MLQQPTLVLGPMPQAVDDTCAERDDVLQRACHLGAGHIEHELHVEVGRLKQALEQLPVRAHAVADRRLAQLLFAYVLYKQQTKQGSCTASPIGACVLHMQENKSCMHGITILVPVSSACQRKSAASMASLLWCLYPMHAILEGCMHAGKPACVPSMQRVTLAEH